MRHEIARWQWALGLLGAVVASACGDPDDGDTIDPSDVQTEDLYGYWVDVETGNVRGFQPADDAYYETFTRPNERADAPVSTAFSASLSGNPRSFRQAATFSVADGAIRETLLVSSPFADPPGTEYLTRIVELRARASLTTETGRTFRYAERCLDTRPPGDFSYRALIDVGDPGNAGCNGTFFAGFARVAVDADGGVHSATTITDLNFSVRDTGLTPCVPTATYWSGGCDARRYPLEFAEHQAITVDATTDSVHIVQDVEADGAPYQVTYRIRDIRSGEADRVFVVPVERPGRSVVLEVFAEGESGTLIVGDTILRRSGESFTVVAPTFPDGAVPTFASSTFDANGRIHALSIEHLFIEGDDAVFEAIPLPRIVSDFGFGSSVAVGADGHVHVVYPYAARTDSTGFVLGAWGVYARWDGSEWQETEIGAIGRSRVVVADDGDPVILHAMVKGGAGVSYFLTRPVGEGLVTERVVRGTIETGSLDAWTAPDLAIGGDTLAYTDTGVTVGVASLSGLFDADRERETVELSLMFQGPGTGRIVSDDGTVDCRADCTVDVPVERFMRFRAIADPGSIALAGPGTPIDATESFTRSGFLVERATTYVVRFDTSATGRIVPLAMQTGSQRLLEVATDDERLCATVVAPEGTLAIGGSVVSAAEISEDMRYVVCGPIAGPYEMWPLPVDASVEPPVMLRLQPEQPLEMFFLPPGAVQIGGADFGDAGSQTLVRARLDDAGQIGDVEALMTLNRGAGARSIAPASSGLSAFFMESTTALTPTVDAIRGVLTIDESGATTLVGFDDDSTMSPIAARPIDAAGDRVLAALDGKVMLIEDGAKRLEVDMGTEIISLDIASGSPVLFLRALGTGLPPRVVTLDADGVETSAEDLPTVGAPLLFDARPEAGYWLSSSPAGDIFVQLLGDDVTTFTWLGSMTVRRVTRAADGRAWLRVGLIRGGMSASFQGLEFEDRAGFLVEMRPIAADISGS